MNKSAYVDGAWVSEFLRYIPAPAARPPKVDRLGVVAGLPGGMRDVALESIKLSSGASALLLSSFFIASLCFNAILNDFSLILGENVAPFISSVAFSASQAFRSSLCLPPAASKRSTVASTVALEFKILKRFRNNSHIGHNVKIERTVKRMEKGTQKGTKKGIEKGIEKGIKKGVEKWKKE